MGEQENNDQKYEMPCVLCAVPGAGGRDSGVTHKTSWNDTFGGFLSNNLLSLHTPPRRSITVSPTGIMVEVL
jgi:hypothetical protein